MIDLPNLVAFCMNKNRAVLAVFIIVMIFGGAAYHKIAKESNPDVALPMINIRFSMNGISPKDSDSLLIEPTRREISSVGGVKEIRSLALNDSGYIFIEFYKNTNIEKVKKEIEDIIEDLRQTDYPRNLNSVAVKEVNLSLFPVINVIMSGDIEEDKLSDLADALKDQILTAQGVLSVDIVGHSKRIVEIAFDQLILENYNLKINDIVRVLQDNNSFVAVGNMKRSHGEYNIQMKTVLQNISDIEDIYLFPNESKKAIKMKDIAKISLVLEDKKTIAKSMGQNALVFEVKKISGYSVVETIDNVKKSISCFYDGLDSNLSEKLNIKYAQDNSSDIKDLISNLENSIIISILIVFCVILCFTGLKSALVVSLVVPGSFLLSILTIYLMGYTINMVILFALIFSVGLIVDPSIVVVEYADRLLSSGIKIKDAFKNASISVFYPIISSTATTQVVFLPLIFWPGITGEFIKFLPITTIIVLFASVLISLIFVPIIGADLFKFIKKDKNDDYIKKINAIESCDVDNFDKITAIYHYFLCKFIKKPIKSIFYIALSSFLILFLFFSFGSGIIFFPDVEPSNVVINIRSRGNFAIQEKLNILNEVEKAIKDIKFDTSVYYGKTVNVGISDLVEKDLIGQIFLQLKKWNKRRNFEKIAEYIKQETSLIDGIIVECLKEQSGPQGGSDIQIVLKSKNEGNVDFIKNFYSNVIDIMNEDNDLIDIKDSIFPDKLQWMVDVKDDLLNYFAIRKSDIANNIKMINDGVSAGKYNHNGKFIDIKLKYKESERNLNSLRSLKINNESNNHIWLSSFADLHLGKSPVGIERIDGLISVYINANVKKHVNINEKVKKLHKAISNIDRDDSITFEFIGQAKDMKESINFLKIAFVLAVSGISIIVLFMFNSYYQTLLIMSSVAFSTIGVVFGSLLTFSPIVVVMSGCAIVALAGISVNNNILLIDAYNHYFEKFKKVEKAVIFACITRFRPILITSLTTIMGLLPMALRINIDFFKLEFTYGSPITQYWVDLSRSIAFGMLFTTSITLFFSPIILIYKSRNKAYTNINGDV